MRILIICLVVAMFSFAIYLVMSGSFSSKPPSPIITVAEKKVEVAQGSYCWNGLFNNVCADTISPSELIKFHGVKPTIVSPESKIKIKFKIEPNEHSLGVNKWLSDGNIESAPLDKNILTVPKEKGIYVYDVFARWEKGDSSYAFVIEVQ
ncbi:hypothetical protein [Bacillus sp. Marseille-P3661]|uniref:hypothetical protein n=1 Tax=Bacillus sp. Marseille-P3661 TaxID=1936234 RepID=UPI0021552047|nr:hypothetical protein [Bacillus sp. Marseille-P3661]